MKDLNPNTIYLKDYTQPAYWISNVDLIFNLEEEQTQVCSTLSLSKNENISGKHPLVLQGEELVLEHISIDGKALAASEYEVTDTDLTIHSVPDAFTLEIKTIIKPQENTSLEGLYKSSGNFCTQCEAEGFRKITYYLDRPDIMAKFTTTIFADKKKYPVLLSNGNPAGSGVEEGGRHWSRWQDPFKKPCYLFALVAGDLAFIEDKFTTMSGKTVDLRIYVQHHNIDQCDHAMHSLIKSMQWDEQVYGREYDLDVYNIVAVDDFNMGAMENKGLNVFNSKYVLAKKETATDVDFINIEGVIGHEYFHNWSGNRVTCRDWFQLTLKEGLTVFRDQRFTADMNAETPKRIDDVNVLRTAQFAEDAGPMAHPIQPDSYLEINNFYTVTVYNKGAEVIRMIHTILGEEGFRKGMDLYFDRHDGQAVTTEDFILAMETANETELTQFRRWYKQSGTPEVSVQESYDEIAQRYELTLKQTTPATAEQETKLAFDIPVRTGLLASSGEDMAVVYEGVKDTSHILRLIQDEQVFVFEEVKEKPVLSLFRGFSAPVKIHFGRSNEELAFCVANDCDGFNRWDAGQELVIRIILNRVNGHQEQSVPDYLVSAYQKTLQNKVLDRALLARALALPSQAYISEMMEVIDVDAIHEAQKFMEKSLGTILFDQWLAVYQQCETVEYGLSTASMGARALKNTALSYMVSSQNEQAEQLALSQFKQASNMTDQLAAFRVLVHHACDSRDQVIEDFYQQWQCDQLVMDKWFMIQATAPQPDTLQRVEKLFEHDDFDLKNPNRVRSLLGAFCSANPICFHVPSGEGYRLLGRYIEKLNDLNPQIASRLTTPLTRWKRFDQQRQGHMTAELDRLKQIPQLSRDVYELVEKSLS
ncbi:MAG: aminopeptidase N [Gammaproteobacteria bacterium]|nr:aminopeptidase N [Gammaproteobacteria bacterium]